MSDPEDSIFDDVDDEADELAMREGEADIAAGRVIPHGEVAKWLRTWGKPGEPPPPKEWFE
jgi:predicted transcriptional regulator